jgi:CRISPR/Cas system-associated exonuclease Cas4 (RecB family)
MSELPKHISYSSFSTWQECGWKYYLTKVEGVQEGHAVWFTGGTAVHKATEVYDLEGGTAEDIWNKVWFEQVAEDEAIHGDMQDWKYAKREDMSWWYGEGIWMLERWIKLRNSGWSVYEDFVEKEYEIPIDDSTVKMAIDRVMVDFEGNRVLLDIKTGASSQRHPLQLAVYAWALGKQGISVDKAGFWDARSGSISLWNLTHLHSERVEDILNTFDKARKETIFLPNLNNCGRCDVISSCKWLHN